MPCYMIYSEILITIGRICISVRGHSELAKFSILDHVPYLFDPLLALEFHFGILGLVSRPFLKRDFITFTERKLDLGHV